jgi:hypothetical protein
MLNGKDTAMTAPDLDNIGLTTTDGFWTSSKWVMLLKVHLRGYTIQLTKQTPVESLFGRVYYKHTWLLQPPESS